MLTLLTLLFLTLLLGQTLPQDHTFVGTYPEVIEKLVFALQADPTPKDQFIIHNQLTSTNNRETTTMELTCQNEEGLTKILLYTGQVYGYIRVNEHHLHFGRDFDLCCMFQWSDRSIPRSHEKHFLHLSQTLTSPGGAVGNLRSIYVRPDGIYTDDTIGGLLQNLYSIQHGQNSVGRQLDFLTAWDETGNYGICERERRGDYDTNDNDLAALTPYLLGSTGYKCASICRQDVDPKSSYWCYTVVTATQTGGNWDWCAPTRDILSLKNTGARLAYQITSSRGLLCKGSCVNYSVDGTKYNYYFCTTQDRYSIDGVTKYQWDYCSSRRGFDYYNRECRNKCDFYGERYRWCWLTEGSWGYCS